MPAAQRPGHERDGDPVHRVLVEVDELHADLRRERRHELGLGEEADVDQGPAQGLPADGLLTERRGQL